MLSFDSGMEIKMKSNIKYANILIIAFGVAFFIIGGMNFGGIITGKVILLCSIVSLGVAIVQILDVIISAMQMIEIRVMKTSIAFLQVWGMENKNVDHSEKILKIEEYKNDQKYIYEKYETLTKKIAWIANIILAFFLIVFILGLSTDIIKENAILADSLSLFSFAFIFISLTVQNSFDKYITNISIQLEGTLKNIEKETFETNE